MPDTTYAAGTQSAGRPASKIRILAECAVMVALSTVLSFIKIYRLPWGGSITLLSMLPVIMFSIRWGLKWGLNCSGLNAIVEM